MKRQTPVFPATPARARGAALIVSLILLVVITLMGLSGMQNASLQERMSGNMYDRSIAMQAAEAALSFAEAQLIANPDNFQDDCRTPGGNANCSVLPPQTFEGSDANWIAVNDAAFIVNAGLAAGTPEFRIQLIFQGQEPNGADQTAGFSDAALNYGSGLSGTAPRDVRIYRVTARSRAPDAADNRSIVVLQTAVRRTL